MAKPSRNGARPRPRAAPSEAAKAAARRAVDRKRAHRRALSLKALEHWQSQGERAKTSYLAGVRRALVAGGFRPTRLQWRHKGHAFGLVKDLGDRQIHVRVYEDGVVDAELEVHRRYLQHLWSPRPSAHRQIADLLRTHGIPTHFVNEKYLPAVGAMRQRFPERRTHVARVAGAAVVMVGPLIAASLARLVLGRGR